MDEWDELGHHVFGIAVIGLQLIFEVIHKFRDLLAYAVLFRCLQLIDVHNPVRFHFNPTCFLVISLITQSRIVAWTFLLMDCHILFVTDKFTLPTNSFFLFDGQLKIVKEIILQLWVPCQRLEFHLFNTVILSLSNHKFEWDVAVFVILTRDTQLH